MEMQFSELLATIQGAGYDVFDARGLPVDQEHQPYLEDENLMSKRARIEFRSPRVGESRGTVADVAVGQHLFQVRGEWHGVQELRHVVDGHRIADDRSAGFGY